MVIDTTYSDTRDTQLRKGQWASATFLFFAIYFCALKKQTASAFGKLVTNCRTACCNILKCSVFVTPGIYTNYCKLQVNLTIRSNMFIHCNFMSLTDGLLHLYNMLED